MYDDLYTQDPLDYDPFEDSYPEDDGCPECGFDWDDCYCYELDLDDDYLGEYRW